MRWLLITVVALIALVVIVALIGLLLPRNHRATSAITIAAPPDSIWSAVRDIGQLGSWWPQVKRVDRLEPVDGRERWREELKGGMTLVIRIAEESRPNRLRTVIEDTGEPFGGEWVYEITPDPNGTTLTITEDGWVSNSIFRFVSKVSGHNRTMDDYLGALAKRLGSSALPEHR